MNKILISISIVIFLFACGKKGALEYSLETSYKINNSSLNTANL
jgi:hypothetical protein